MADEGFDYVSKIKILLGIEDSTLDETLQLYLEITIQSVLNYCNISELPSALDYLVCRLVADAYRTTNSHNKVGEVVGNVSSISEDGRKVDFSLYNSSSIEDFLAGRLSKTRELNRFKKLYRIPQE